MSNIRENIRIINFDSIVLILIVFFGLLIYNGNFRNSPEHNRNPVSACVTINQSSAVSTPDLRLQIFQKTWVSNKDNFNPLAFNRNPLIEDKKTDMRISHLQNIRQNSFRVPLFILCNHLFPAETDEPPFLS